MMMIHILEMLFLKLFLIINESKTNNVNRFNYNAQEHSDYRRYSPYTNHYGENKNYFF